MDKSPYSISVIIIAVWMLIVGAVWATWITMTAHDLGVLTMLVALVVLFIEIFLWHPWRRV